MNFVVYQPVSWHGHKFMKREYYNKSLLSEFENEAKVKAFITICGNARPGYTHWLEKRVAKAAETQPETAGRTMAGVAPTTEQSTKICPVCGESMVKDDFGNFRCCNRSCQS